MPSLTPQIWSTQLHEALTTAHQRSVVDVAGDLAWCQQVASDFCSNKHALIISEQADLFASLPVISNSKSIQLLGQEFDVVVYDALNGLDIDALARVTGLIKAPGLLLLLHPPNDDWLKQHDAKNIWQNEQQGHHFFIAYLQQQLSSTDVYSCYQHKPLKPITPLAISLKTTIDSSSLLSAEQQAAWTQLNSVIHQDKLSCSLLAARGRGKSTLLGKWLSQVALASKQFIITSQSKKAAGHCLNYVNQQSNVRYVAIDALLQQHPSADCVVVDEAATIPLAQLFELKELYSRVIYTSTLDGYEGTGQGFELQFLSTFKADSLTSIKLSTPMRWGEGDLLESWLSKTLLLNEAENTVVNNASVIDYQLVTQKQLSQSRTLLLAVFNLLKTAHYRTQASDIKMLLDNPDISLWTASQHEHLIGVLVLNKEGGLSAELTQAIYFATRRPLGHLLAQSLTAQAGCAEFAQLSGYRVQRIAVEKGFRRQGVASELMHFAIEHAQQNHADYLGAVFALDEKRLNFWSSNKLTLMEISVGYGTSTGKPAVTMLLALKPSAMRYVEQCQKQLALSFSERLLTHFKTMPAAQVASLLPLMPNLGLNNRALCEPYINGFKGFDYALFDLRRYVLWLLQQPSTELANHEKSLLIECILQAKHWDILKNHYGFSGKKELNKALKKVL